MFRSVEEALGCLETFRCGAVAAFEGRGGFWHWKPADKGPAWYEWCDDCLTYHKNWYVFGYEVFPGRVMCLVWSIDQDGLWEVADEAAVGSVAHSNLCLTYGERAWRRSFTQYMRYVARTMTDPCHEFLAPPVVSFNERWRIHVFERGGCVWLMRCELLSQGSVIGSFRPGEECFPKYLSEFLKMERLADVGGYAMDPRHARFIRDIDKNWKPGENRGQYHADMDVRKEMPAMNDEDWGQELRRRARAALDQP